MRGRNPGTRQGRRYNMNWYLRANHYLISLPINVSFFFSFASLTSPVITGALLSLSQLMEDGTRTDSPEDSDGQQDRG